MKILKIIAVIVAIFLVIVALQPSTFHIARSVTIAAPAERVFEQVNDLKKSMTWSPWVKLDPAAKYTFEGPAAGVGAASTWSGNDQVGVGRQTITGSRPNAQVQIRLDFEKPFKATCQAEFDLKSEGNHVTVTWSMSGANNFLAKAVCLFMNQDKMIGGSFEEGLAKLKALSEAPGK